MNLVKTKVLSKQALVGEAESPVNMDSLYALIMIYKELNSVPTAEQLGFLAKSIDTDYNIVLQAFEDVENPHLEMLANAEDLGEGEGIADSLGMGDAEMSDEGTNVLHATSIGEDENALIEFSGVDDIVNGPFGAPTNDPLNQALKMDSPIDTTELHPEQLETLRQVQEDVKDVTQGEE